MRTAGMAAAVLFVAAAASDVLTQAPAAPAGPTFDVASVKRHVTPAGAGPVEQFNSTVRQSPDGGLTMLNVPAGTLVARAYSAAPVDMVGLPGWAMSERYDLIATASLVTKPAPVGRSSPTRGLAVWDAM